MKWSSWMNITSIVFKYDGEKLSLFQKIETGYQHNFLTLDVADVNRNGFAEIIVTSVVEDDLRSFILEYEEGKFRKITEKAGWFFRVLDHPKEGPTLMGQRMGSDGISVGPIYKFIWKKKSFEKGPKMPFPKETNIFGLALANIREKDKSDLIVLDDLERLRIVAQRMESTSGAAGIILEERTISTIREEKGCRLLDLRSACLESLYTG